MKLRVLPPLFRHAAATAALALLLGGCSDDDPQAVPAPSPPTESAPPAYDARLEPAAAVLPLVPESATRLSVTDFGRIRLQLGVTIDAQSSPGARAGFWRRAEAETPLLTSGLLRPVESSLLANYGFTQDDVEWEAHFFEDRSEAGWVLSFDQRVDMGAVKRAVRDGIDPLRGARVVAADHLLVLGGAGDPLQSWGADPATVALVGDPANASYVERGCLPLSASVRDLEPLESFAIGFEGELATARLGPGRLDLFVRMRYALEEATFAAGFTGGVADPSTGRVGYRMTDPAAAAELALRRTLPFAACGEDA